MRERYQRNGHDDVRYDALVLDGERPILAADHTAIYRLRRAPRSVDTS